MNNPEEIKMGLDAAGFNPNIQQPKTVNNTNISNVDNKKASVQNPVGINNVAKLNLENTVEVNFNVGKTSSKELKNVNIFEQDSIGRTAMKSAADSIDLINGPLNVLGKDLLAQLRAV